MSTKEYIAELVSRSRAAQAEAEHFDQKRVDELCAAIAWHCVNDDFRRQAASMLIEESGGMGLFEDKVKKIGNKIRGCYSAMKDEISVGVLEEDPERQLVTYLKPMGVIGAILPVTQGEAIPIFKTLMALKGRNSIILSPHPKGKKTCQYEVDYMRSILRKYNAPEDLVITIDPQHVSIEASQELMHQVDFIIATGGTPMVRVAYSSGTPAIGVGTGNDCCYVDTTADLAHAAQLICQSKLYDNSTSCSSENSVLADETIYEDLIAEFERVGAYIIREDSPEKEALRKTIWPEWPANHNINRAVLAADLTKIAAMAGIDIPDGTTFIAVEENRGIGHDYPFTGEKLCRVTTLIKTKNFEDALDKIETVYLYMGEGHGCAIHTKDDKKVDTLARRIKASRIMVNQANSIGNSGSWTNGIPVTMTLGCSTWGHNSTSKNVTWKDLVNFTVVSKPVEPKIPSDEDLFPDEIRAVTL